MHGIPLQSHRKKCDCLKSLAAWLHSGGPPLSMQVKDQSINWPLKPEGWTKLTLNSGKVWSMNGAKWMREAYHTHTEWGIQAMAASPEHLYSTHCLWINHGSYMLKAYILYSVLSLAFSSSLTRLAYYNLFTKLQPKIQATRQAGFPHGAQTMQDAQTQLRIENGCLYSQEKWIFRMDRNARNERLQNFGAMKMAEMARGVCVSS